MLLEFTVENYRSIKEPVTLSAVAQKAPKRKSAAKTKRGVKSDAEICPGFPVEGWDMALLPVIGIFGANASGKSNVIQALDYLVLRLSGHHFKEYSHFFPISHQPFKLDDTVRGHPTKFDIHLALNRTIYKYHVEFRGQRILEESLNYLPPETKRQRLLFQRKWDEEASQFHWKNGDVFMGSHIQLESSVGNEELFIALMNRLTVRIMMPFTEYLSHYSGSSILLPIRVENEIVSNVIWETNAGSPDFKGKIVDILRKFDTGILDLEFKENQNSRESGIYAVHHNSQGERIAWKFEEESLGTQRLFGFAFSLITSLEHGGLVLFDELGTNLHPQITSYIIQLFQSPKTNPKGAQLIFTSHDNTLQRNQLLRRDQIWFTEKRPDQSTDLYSLADFKVRNDLAIDKAYLDGRFGAVPFLPETVEELLGVD